MPYRSRLSFLLFTALLLSVSTVGAIAGNQVGPNANRLTPQVHLDTTTTRHFRQGQTYVARLYADPAAARAAGDPAAIGAAAKGGVGAAIAVAPANSSGFGFRSQSEVYTAWFPTVTGGAVRLEQGPYWVEFGLGEGSRVSPQSAPRPDTPIPGPAPAVAGARATYPDPVQSLRYEYEVQPTRLKESIVLETPRTAYAARFPLALAPELTAVAEHGAIRIWRTDFPGLAIFTIEPAWAEDAAGRRTTAVTQEVVTEGDQTFVHLRVDPEWLAAPDRAWPVTIDPTVNIGGGETAARVIESVGGPSREWRYDGIYRNTHFNEARNGLLRLDHTTLVRQGVGRIARATLTLSYSPGEQGGSFAVHTLSRDWAPNGVTWTHADRFAGTAWSTPGGDTGRAVATVTLPPYNSATRTADVTDLVRGWVLGGEPNYGFLFTCTPTQNSFCTAYVNAVIEVAYEVDTAPPTVSVTAPTVGTGLTGPTTVTAKADDNYGLHRVEFLVDGAVAATAHTAPYQFTLDPAAYPRGEHTLAARAWDQAGQPATSRPVTVAFATGLGPLAAPRTGPDPSPPQPQVTAFLPLGPEELGLDRRWGYRELPVPGGYVSLRNGNLVLTATDSVLPAPGLATAFRRTYNSRDPRTHPFGRGWLPNSGQRIADLGTAALWHRADGSSVRFARAADGAYTPEAGVYDRLRRLGSEGWELERKDGIVARFSANGELAWMQDRNGNRITYQLDGSRRVVGVLDSVGRRATIGYDPATGRITRIQDGAGRTFTYSYDPHGRLARVSGPSEYSYHYGYHETTGLLTSLTDPVGRRWHFDYDTSGRLTGVKDPAGGWTLIRYE